MGFCSYHNRPLCSISLEPVFIVYLVLKRYSQRSFIWKPYNTIFFILAAWSLSVLLCSVPIFLYHKSDFTVVKYCSVERLFGADLHKGMLMMLVGPYVCPLILINIIYSILFCKLRTLRVQPQTSTNNAVSSPVHAADTVIRRPILTNGAALSAFSCSEMNETESRGDLKSTFNSQWSVPSFECDCPKIIIDTKKYQPHIIDRTTRV